MCLASDFHRHVRNGRVLHELHRLDDSRAAGGCRRSSARGRCSSTAAAEAGADAAGEVEQPEALRRLVRLALGDGQRVARAVEVAEGAAQPARVALPPVDDVEACRVRQLAQQSGVVASEWTLLDASPTPKRTDFAEQPVGCGEVEVELLRWQRELLAYVSEVERW